MFWDLAYESANCAKNAGTFKNIFDKHKRRPTPFDWSNVIWCDLTVIGTTHNLQKLI